MPSTIKAVVAPLTIAALFVVLASTAHAQNKYDPGASDTEIKIGNIMPYSGAASSYGTVGKAEAAYFRKINMEGGINGRKITFISYDDAYSPPKAVEQTRKLVENDEVLLIFGALGTPSNSATRKYLNSKKVPQIFVASGASKFGDPQGFPWTMGFGPTYKSEGRVYAKYILEHFPNSKVAVFWQNDDSAKDSLAGLREALGAKGGMIVADKSYEITDPTIDSQIVGLKDSGADVLISFSAPKAAAQAIRKVAELGWKPVFFQSSSSSSVAAVLRPAGLENAKGMFSTAVLKDPTDPAWKDDPATNEWLKYMDKFFPDGNKADVGNVAGYVAAQTLVQVLRQCGDDLTRENVMRQAANLRDFSSKMLLPGIKVNTSPTDFYPIEQMKMMQFDGEAWRLLGDIIDTSSTE
jgi:ABC-type branched-subunit amino acid transport system substrate-binding protein